MVSESSKKVYIRPKSTHHEYTEWIYKTPFTEFVFTHNNKTNEIFGQRTGDNEYSGFGNAEARRVISELHLVLIGL